MGLTPVLIELARRRGWVDQPNARSVHKQPIARLGGVAIFFAAMLATLPVLFVQNTIGDSFRDLGIKILALLTGASMMFALGLYDDLHGLRARFKLLTQLAAAILVCACGIHIQSITVQDLFALNFGIYGCPITILWIVGITNAVNIIDGLDGLAAGISAIACGVIAIMAVLHGNVVLAILMLALLGSLTGFLFFNFSPAKIFMGDCGSLYIGFTIATASVITGSKTYALAGIALPILVLGIPIFDTLFSMLRRFLQRRGMMSADRSHFHHR
jgi:UDP-GlcNAc:undecaprenyl-phosphate GlcNAc-1-phosphate transferase